MILLLGLLLFPIAMGFFINWIMKRDAAEEARKAKVSITAIKVRYFRLRPKAPVLCAAHLNQRKPNQLAVIDKTRCQFCLDKVSKT